MDELLAVTRDGMESEMRIVKYGTDPADNKVKAKCQNCGTVIEFMSREAERVHDQRDGDYWRIKCPVCPRDITKAVVVGSYL